ALAFLAASGFRVVAEHTMDVVFKRLQDVTPAQIFATAKRVLAFSTVGGWRLYPLQSVVGGGRHAADRELTRHSGGDGRARRLLGGVSLPRHHRSHRRSRPADVEPERDGASGHGGRGAWMNAFSGREAEQWAPSAFVR